MAKLNIADIRQEYTKGGLRENELPGDPLSLFTSPAGGLIYRLIFLILRYSICTGIPFRSYIILLIPLLQNFFLYFQHFSVIGINSIYFFLHIRKLGVNGHRQSLRQFRNNLFPHQL